MRLIGAAGAFGRTLARIGHRQGGGDHQHLAQGALVARGENHPADLRIERQLRQLAADRRQPACRFIHRAKLAE